MCVCVCVCVCDQIRYTAELPRVTLFQIIPYKHSYVKTILLFSYNKSYLIIEINCRDKDWRCDKKCNQNFFSNHGFVSPR